MACFIRAKYLLPLSDKLGRTTRIVDGYVVYETDKILEVGSYSDEIGRRLINTYKPLEVIGNTKPHAHSINELTCHHGVILPGFVKAHGHESESPIIGIAKDMPLTKWLDEAVNPFFRFIEEKNDELTKLLGELPLMVTYLKSRLDDIYYGITSCLAHHCSFAKYHVDEEVGANERAGTRMVIAIGSQDRNYYPKAIDKNTDEIIQRIERNHRKYQNLTRTRIIPGPDQCFSNSPEVLKRLKQWAKDHQTLIHIHSSEEFQSTESFKKEYGMTPVQYFDSIGFLDADSLLAHQVQCTDEDLAILKRTGAKVIHNPLANTILGSGMPPVVKMLQMGIPVAIATDGSGSADNQNILAAARLASQYQKAYHKDPTLLPAQKLLEMITIEPAKMLKLNNGSLEEGKCADIILIDLRRPNLAPTTQSNVVENLIWATDGSEVQYVIAAGKLLKNDYGFTTLKRKNLQEKMQILGEQLEIYKRKNM